jgi:hypothetical protein
VADGDRMIQMLYTDPQFYVDTGVIDWRLRALAATC